MAASCSMCCASWRERSPRPESPVVRVEGKCRQQAAFSLVALRSLTSIVGAHPVRDRNLTVLPLRRLVAHRVRSYRRPSAHRSTLLSDVGAHPVRDLSLAASPLRRLVAHRVRSYRRTNAHRSTLLSNVGAHPVRDRSLAVLPLRRLVAHRVRSHKKARPGSMAAYADFQVAE